MNEEDQMNFGMKNLPAWIMTAGFLFVAGCATAPQRDYSGDIDSLNAKVSSLQNELSAKDAEMAKLESQMSRQEAALKYGCAEGEQTTHSNHHATTNCVITCNR